jgi:PKD repeat protein
MKNKFMTQSIVALMMVNAIAFAETTPKSYVTELDSNGNALKTFELKKTGYHNHAHHSTSKSNTSKTTQLDFITYSGQDAIDRLGNQLESLSKKHGMTPEYLTEQFLSDDTLKIDSDGNMLYVEADVDEITDTKLNVTPPSAFPFNGDAFKLHSKPNATKKIYIDFDGHVATKTAWNKVDKPTITADPFNIDGNMGVDTERERTAIYHIWASVAEDFLPFDVDVTTEEPTPDELLRSDTTDVKYGTRVVITTTHSTKVCTNCGGVAYVGVFNYVGSDFFKPAWVFYNALNYNNKAIAEAISHEAGHNLGLHHDGIKNGTAYYYGIGTWAPIMGAGYYKPVTQWSNGTYPNASNTQDDIAVMLSRGLTVRSDDHYNTIEHATSLTNDKNDGDVTHIKPQYGIIETESDTDMFSFTNQYAGEVKFDVSTNVININNTTTLGNLDTTLTIYDSNGNVVISDAPEDKTSSSIFATLQAGTYYVGITSSGKNDVPYTHGYSKYGSLGQYMLTGYYTSQQPTRPPEAKITASTLTGEAPLVVSFSGIDSVKGSKSIKSYYWSFGNGKYSTSPTPNNIYTTPGTYTVSLTVTDENNLTNTTTTTVKTTAPISKAVSVTDLSIRLQTAGSLVNATSIITVRDNLNKAIPNVTVFGKFSGSLYSVKTGVVKINENEVKGFATRNGVVGITSPRYKNAAGTINFEVTKVVVNGLTYNPLANKKSIVSITKK